MRFAAIRVSMACTLVAWVRHNHGLRPFTAVSDNFQGPTEPSMSNTRYRTPSNVSLVAG